jgi:pyrroline-5-carboxylate reductase
MGREIIILGGGNLGLAFARGLAGDRPPGIGAVTVVERDAGRRDIVLNDGEKVVSGLESQLPFGAIVVIAVKPSDVETLSQSLYPRLKTDSIVVSCVAGLSLTTLSGFLGGHRRLVRCMPNLAASCRQSITAFFAKEELSADDVSLVGALLSRIGAVVKIDDEELMHAITAISGSGPGYLAWMADVMVKASIELGIPAPVSHQLVQHTFNGLAHLMLDSELSPAEIWKRVSSPNGTTQAAIGRLEDNRVADSLREAIIRAADRSRELGQEGEAKAG